MTRKASFQSLVIGKQATELIPMHEKVGRAFNGTRKVAVNPRFHFSILSITSLFSRNAHPRGSILQIHYAKASTELTFDMFNESNNVKTHFRHATYSIPRNAPLF